MILYLCANLGTGLQSLERKDHNLKAQHGVGHVINHSSFGIPIAEPEKLSLLRKNLVKSEYCFHLNHL